MRQTTMKALAEARRRREKYEVISGGMILLTLPVRLLAVAARLGGQSWEWFAPNSLRLRASA